MAALDSTRLSFDPNARYDMGANAAGCGRASLPATLQAATDKGLGADGVLLGADLRVGLNAAGVSRNNPGPNVAGAPRGINNT